MARYLIHTKGWGLNFKPQVTMKGELVCHTDAGFGSSNLESHMSTTGYVVMLDGVLLSYGSKSQKVCATSSTEAEFYAMFATMQQTVFVRDMLTRMGWKARPAIVYTDSMPAMAIAKSRDGLQNSARTYSTKVERVRQWIQAGIFEVRHCRTHECLADALTKAKTGKAFMEFRGTIMANTVRKEHVVQWIPEQHENF